LEDAAMMDEDWKVLTSFFPENWKELAVTTNALKGLRKNKSEEHLLRTLLIHLACGYSLRETAVRAKQACLADLSAVALWKRLKKSKEWLYSLCLALFEQHGVDCREHGGFQVRLFDATTVKEPGKTGSLWRIHYSVRLPSLSCDFFKLTETQGKGTGESLLRFPIQAGDYVIADRGYSTAPGIHYARSQKACVTVRLNTQSLPLRDLKKKDFPLLNVLQSIRKPGEIGSWPVLIPNRDEDFTKGRLCAVRKTQEAARMAEKKLNRRATRRGHKLRPETLIYCRYVMVFTTFPEKEFSAFDVLQWYRIRWQVELVFKRFKQIAALGHLPKNDEESAKAWLYGKLFVALLSEKLINYASSVSPWGYDLAKLKTPKPMA
jgi:hypothetical protein